MNRREGSKRAVADRSSSVRCLIIKLHYSVLTYILKDLE
jgi:hypothetical protein